MNTVLASEELLIQRIFHLFAQKQNELEQPSLEDVGENRITGDPPHFD